MPECALVKAVNADGNNAPELAGEVTALTRGQCLDIRQLALDSGRSGYSRFPLPGAVEREGERVRGGGGGVVCAPEHRVRHRALH